MRKCEELECQNKELQKQLSELKSQIIDFSDVVASPGAASEQEKNIMEIPDPFEIDVDWDKATFVAYINWSPIFVKVEIFTNIGFLFHVFNGSTVQVPKNDQLDQIHIDHVESMNLTMPFVVSEKLKNIICWSFQSHITQYMTFSKLNCKNNCSVS